MNSTKPNKIYKRNYVTWLYEGLKFRHILFFFSQEHISYNGLIYNLYNVPIIIRHLIKNICDALNLKNMSDIESNFFIK